MTRTSSHSLLAFNALSLQLTHRSLAEFRHTKKNAIAVFLSGGDEAPGANRKLLGGNGRRGRGSDQYHTRTGSNAFHDTAYECSATAHSRFVNTAGFGTITEVTTPGREIQLSARVLF